MLLRPVRKVINQTIRNTKNKILAIPADVPAIPPKPKTAAIIAITKNTNE